MYRVCKRFLDILMAIILLVACSPLFLIMAIAVKIEDSRGPVFHKSRRIGRNNREFTVYKFRSMIMETTRGGMPLTDAERMLRVGGFIRKFSLDELPQAWNILRGEMSFIGPRPLPAVYLDYFSREELHRHDVRPGISGWAQVNGRNRLTWEEKFAYDLYYVRYLSCSLDLRILLRTLKKTMLRSDVGIRGIDIPDISLYDVRTKVGSDRGDESS